MELDLHIHTRYSFDSAMKPAKIIDIAKARGLSGVAITDHNTVEGALETQKIAPPDFVVIIGEEIGTKAGDIIGLFLKEEITDDDPLDVIAKIKSQGGIAILAHPFVQHLSIEDKVAKKLDACEGFNARHTRCKKFEGRCEKRITEFANHYHLPLVAGSDAHFYGEIGNARTKIPASNFDQIKSTIKRGETIITGVGTSSLGLFISGLLKIIRYIINPVPEAYTLAGKRLLQNK